MFSSCQAILEAALRTQPSLERGFYSGLQGTARLSWLRQLPSRATSYRRRRQAAAAALIGEVSVLALIEDGPRGAPT